jgi:hypothetical protein
MDKKIKTGKNKSNFGSVGLNYFIVAFLLLLMIGIFIWSMFQ